MTESEIVQQAIAALEHLSGWDSDKEKRGPAFGLLAQVIKQQQDAITSLQARVKKLERARQEDVS